MLSDQECHAALDYIMQPQTHLCIQLMRIVITQPLEAAAS